MNKPYRLLALLVASSFVFGPALLYAAGVRPVAFENRPLAEAPKPSQGWDFFEGLPPWASDHVPGRKQAVRASSWIDYYALNSLPRTAGTMARTTTSPAGEVVTRAPQVVRGQQGYLFYGPEFDSACEAGAAFSRGLQNLARLAEVIERSGRSVVFTVAPDKSSVLQSLLPQALPRGECARRGMASQVAALESVDHRSWLPVRQRLVAETARGEQLYWKTDTHWNSKGSATYAELLRQRLNSTGSALRTKPAPKERRGDLTVVAGLFFRERAPGAVVQGTKVVEKPGSARYTPAKDVYGVNSWRTTPAAGLVRGRTLLAGDSFTYYGLPTLRHVFADGRFLWTVARPRAKLLDEIIAADTVVLQVVQRSVRFPSHPLVDPRFRRALEDRLQRETRPVRADD